MKLSELIRQMKAEIAAAKRLVVEGQREDAMALAGQKKARGMRRIEAESQEKTTTL